MLPDEVSPEVRDSPSCCKKYDGKNKK